MKKLIIGSLLTAAAVMAQADESWDTKNGRYFNNGVTTVTATLLDGKRDTIVDAIVTNAVAVEAGAFANCPKLKWVFLSPTLDDPNAIGTNAFLNCPQLKAVSFTGLTFLGADRMPNYPYGAPQERGRDPQVLFIFRNREWGEWGQAVNQSKGDGHVIPRD